VFARVDQLKADRAVVEQQPRKVGQETAGQPAGGAGCDLFDMRVARVITWMSTIAKV
jgi:hypothetical protein